jgi:hypothetical protein
MERKGGDEMKLLTEALRAKLPKLYETEDTPTGDKIAWVKFFTPDSNWTWYALEFDGEDTFFGLVEGFDTEFGYFSLSELETVTGPLGLKVERDLYWTPKPLREVPACPAWAKTPEGA